MHTAPEVRERAAMPYHRWSVAEYHRMATSGLLDETARVELIEGELIDLAPIGSKHAFRVDCIARALQRAAGTSVLVRVQNPVLPGEHSEPQPGIAVVKDKRTTPRRIQAPKMCCCSSRFPIPPSAMTAT